MAVAIEFGSQGQASSGGTDTATITGLDFNAEASDRLIAISLALEAAQTVSSVTIGGVSASALIQAVSTQRQSEIWMAAVATGTSGSVVVTLSASATETVSVATYSITGADSTPTDTDSATGSGATIAISALTIPTDGAGIVGWIDSTEAAVTWTGATEQHDTSTGASFQHSSAIVTTAGTNTITADGATAAQALVGVAFGPAAGGGVEGVVAQTLGAATQSSTGKLAIKANGDKTLSAFTQTSTGSGGRRGDVTQTLGAVGQSSTTGRLRIKGQV